MVGMDIYEKIKKYCVSAPSPIKEVLAEMIKQNYLSDYNFVNRVVIEYNEQLNIYELDKMLNKIGYSVKSGFKFIEGNKRFIELKFESGEKNL